MRSRASWKKSFQNISSPKFLSHAPNTSDIKCHKEELFSPYKKYSASINSENSICACNVFLSFFLTFIDYLQILYCTSISCPSTHRQTHTIYPLLLQPPHQNKMTFERKPKNQTKQTNKWKKNNKKQNETERNKQPNQNKQQEKKKQKNFVEVVVETVESHLTLVYPLVLSSSLVNVHFHSNDSFGSGPLPSATQSITGSHWASLGYPVLFYVLSSMSSSFESVGPSPLHALVVHRWGECWVRPTHTLRSGIRW